MSVISPISAAFHSSQRQTKDQPKSDSGKSKPNLPVLVQNKQARGHVLISNGNFAPFLTQLIAGPVARGIKANQCEKTRFFAAYRPAQSANLPKQEKWA